MKASSLFHVFASAVAAALPAAAAGCGTSPPLSCPPFVVSIPTDEGGTPIDGGLDSRNCPAACGTGICDLNPDGKTVICHPICLGRRPQGLVEDDPAPDACGLGDYFAEAALLESASVNAFRILADELARFRAPRRLVKAARRAKRDETRHARLTGALARRFGSVPSKPSVAPPRTRELVDVAIENAIEGCVHETFAALAAHWQATHAKDPDVRAAMTRIARDETRHAALAWQTNAWIRTRLSRREWERVVAAKDQAVRQVSERQAEPPSELANAAGAPGMGVSRVLVSVLRERLWNGFEAHNVRA